MQTPGRTRHWDSPEPDDGKEYRHGVQAIMAAVETSRRFRNREPHSQADSDSVSETRTASAQEQQSIVSSSDTATDSSTKTAWRMLRRRQNGANSFSRRGKKVTPVERARRLEDMRDREDVAAYNNSRLAARLEILDTFINEALTDDMFMGRQEMNPWRFRRNQNLNRRWKFVHDVMVTQELIDTIQTAKQRKAAEDQRKSQASFDKRGSPDGERERSQKASDPQCSQIEVWPEEDGLVKGGPSAGLSNGTDQGKDSTQTERAGQEKVLQGSAEEDLCPGLEKRDDQNVENRNKGEIQTEKEEETSAPSLPSSNTTLSSSTKTRPKTNLQPLKSKTSQSLPLSKPTEHDPAKSPPKDKVQKKIKKRYPKMKREAMGNVSSPLPALTFQKAKPETKPVVNPTAPAGGEPRELVSSPGSSTSSLSSIIIYGFGSHHRKDRCDYCGRTRCAGMRNRGRMREVQLGHGVRHYLRERKNDIEGIYDTKEKASSRCRKRLVKRMQQLEI